MANRRWTSQFLYQYETMPVLLSCKFIVNPTDTGGLGITSLKGPGIKSVYMHTSATPATGNPNPASGFIQVQFQDNFARLLGFFHSIHDTSTGAALTATVNHTTYLINALGTATTAQWQAVGLPAGVTPAVNAAFTATATATIGGSATVKAVAASGITAIEICGGPDTTIALSNSQTNGGGIITLQCLAATNSSTTTLVPTAPLANSVIALAFYLSNSANTVSGQ